MAEDDWTVPNGAWKPPPEPLPPPAAVPPAAAAVPSGLAAAGGAKGGGRCKWDVVKAAVLTPKSDGAEDLAGLALQQFARWAPAALQHRHKHTQPHPTLPHAPNRTTDALNCATSNTRQPSFYSPPLRNRRVRSARHHRLQRFVGLGDAAVTSHSPAAPLLTGPAQDATPLPPAPLVCTALPWHIPSADCPLVTHVAGGGGGACRVCAEDASRALCNSRRAATPPTRHQMKRTARARAARYMHVERSCVTEAHRALVARRSCRALHLFVFLSVPHLRQARSASQREVRSGSGV
jgi:hypothetical protein